MLGSKKLKWGDPRTPVLLCVAGTTLFKPESQEIAKRCRYMIKEQAAEITYDYGFIYTQIHTLIEAFYVEPQGYLSIVTRAGERGEDKGNIFYQENIVIYL